MWALSSLPGGSFEIRFTVPLSKNLTKGATFQIQKSPKSNIREIKNLTSILWILDLVEYNLLFIGRFQRYSICIRTDGSRKENRFESWWTKFKIFFRIFLCEKLSVKFLHLSLDMYKIPKSTATLRRKGRTKTTFFAKFSCTPI